MMRWLILPVVAASLLGCNQPKDYNEGPCGARYDRAEGRVDVDPLQVDIPLRFEFVTPTDREPIEIVLSVSAESSGVSLSRAPSIEPACFLGPIISHEGAMSFEAVFSDQLIHFDDESARVERPQGDSDGVGGHFHLIWPWENLPADIQAIAPEEDDAWIYNTVVFRMVFVHNHPTLGTTGNFGFYIGRDNEVEKSSVYFASGTVHAVDEDD